MVARQLVFYKWSDVNAKSAFQPHRAVMELRDKIAGDAQFAVLQNDEVTTAVEVVSPGTEIQPAKLQLLALRDEDNRPSQWKPGEPLTALSMPADSYPSDVSHVMIWPDHIAAQDLHHNAPRLGRLSFYLRHQVHANVTFEPLYQPDMIVRLQQLRGRLRGVEISLTRPEYVEPNKGAFSTLLPAVWGPRVPSLALHLGMGRRGPRVRRAGDGRAEYPAGADREGVDRVGDLLGDRHLPAVGADGHVLGHVGGGAERLAATGDGRQARRGGEEPGDVGGAAAVEDLDQPAADRDADRVGAPAGHDVAQPQRPAGQDREVGDLVGAGVDHQQRAAVPGQRDRALPEAGRAAADPAGVVGAGEGKRAVGAAGEDLDLISCGCVGAGVDPAVR